MNFKQLRNRIIVGKTRHRYNVNFEQTKRNDSVIFSNWLAFASVNNFYIDENSICCYIILMKRMIK